MRKTFLSWATVAATVFLLCGGVASPIPVGAGRDKDASDLVQNGTHFLVRLDQELNSTKDKVSKSFEVKTLEPLETAKGYVIPAGARIVGHISRIEPGGLTGVRSPVANL